MGGAGGNLVGVPWGCWGRGPLSGFPPPQNVREPLELFPISPSGPLGVGVRSGTAEAAAPTTNPQARHDGGRRLTRTAAARWVVGVCDRSAGLV